MSLSFKIYKRLFETIVLAKNSICVVVLATRFVGGHIVLLTYICYSILYINIHEDRAKEISYSESLTDERSFTYEKINYPLSSAEI